MIPKNFFLWGYVLFFLSAMSNVLFGIISGTLMAVLFDAYSLFLFFYYLTRRRKLWFRVLLIIALFTVCGWAVPYAYGVSVFLKSPDPDREAAFSRTLKSALLDGIAAVNQSQKRHLKYVLRKTGRHQSIVVFFTTFKKIREDTMKPSEITAVLVEGKSIITVALSKNWTRSVFAKDRSGAREIFERQLASAIILK